MAYLSDSLWKDNTMCFKVGIVVQAFNPKHSENRDKQILEFESSLVYMLCSQARQGHKNQQNKPV